MAPGCYWQLLICIKLCEGENMTFQSLNSYNFDAITITNSLLDVDLVVNS